MVKLNIGVSKRLASYEESIPQLFIVRVLEDKLGRVHIRVVLQVQLFIPRGEFSELAVRLDRALLRHQVAGEIRLNLD